MYMEGFDKLSHQAAKHKAILKAKELIRPGEVGQVNPGEATKKQSTEELSRSAVLTKMFTYFKNGVHNSKPAKEYLQKRCLDFTKTEVGYNSGQFHHGKRKDEALIKSCIRYGILLDLGVKARTGNPAYKAFGKWGIVFPLRNREGQIVSLYFRSTLDDKTQRHYYLKNRQGLYPGYPSIAIGAETKRLILTESIIDAATLLEQEEIKTRYKVLALYGTNGLTAEHQQAIKELERLEEIIFFLNGDEAGRKAVAKYAPMLKGDYPSVSISNVQVPENEDVNSLLQGHSPELLTHLLETRKEYDFLFSNENQLKEKGTKSARPAGGLPAEVEVIEGVQKPESRGISPKVSAGLDASNPYNLKYKGNEARYQIKGFKIQQLDSLKITLQIEAL